MAAIPCDATRSSDCRIGSASPWANGARTIAVVSTDEKGKVARAAGADDVVLLDGFKDAVGALTSGAGVDVVVDVVGGEVFTDSLRSLAAAASIAHACRTASD